MSAVRSTNAPRKYTASSPIAFSQTHVASLAARSIGHHDALAQSTRLLHGPIGSRCGSYFRLEIIGRSTGGSSRCSNLAAPVGGGGNTVLQFAFPCRSNNAAENYHERLQGHSARRQ